MRTIETVVYQFEELTDAAKERAREWWRERALDYEWWDSTYDDAKRIGLEITSFDLDRNRHATGGLIWNAQTVAANIMQEHGDTCDTFKLASQFITDLAKLDMASDGYDDKVEEMESEFKRALLEEYSIILQKESEYLTSNENVDETIRINEYTFTADGKRMG